MTTRVGRFSTVMRGCDVVQAGGDQVLESAPQPGPLLAVALLANAGASLRSASYYRSTGCKKSASAWLLAVTVQRTSKPETAASMRERGLRHFAEREEAHAQR